MRAADLDVRRLGQGPSVVLTHGSVVGGERLYELAGTLEPLEFLRAFRGGVGSTHATPERLGGELLHGAGLLMRERPPWEADPPLEVLASAAFPKLVISGGHSPVFEAVCDAIAARIGARRVVTPGRGHTIPAIGSPYNELLHAFLSESEHAEQLRSRPHAPR
jgi:hypothetical protein